MSTYQPRHRKGYDSMEEYAALAWARQRTRTPMFGDYVPKHRACSPLCLKCLPGVAL